ncbi:transposable element Tcb2 transposase [Trichonephila clavipes]|nr:transposable element Tcb2 transposase [Trichonephila clavipes]
MIADKHTASLTQKHTATGQLVNPVEGMPQFPKKFRDSFSLDEDDLNEFMTAIDDKEVDSGEFKDAQPLIAVSILETGDACCLTPVVRADSVSTQTCKSKLNGNMSRKWSRTECNNRIVMAQKKNLGDFLRGRIIGRLECGHTKLELGITQSVISRFWQRFRDDGNVSRCYSTGRPRVTTPNEDRYFAITTKRKD